MSMIHLVQRQGRTILFSSHILADVERVADRIGILVDGVLRVDCPTEHFKQSVSKLVLEFPGRPPAFPGCSGLVQAWEVGHRLELVIVNFGPDQRQVIESLSPLAWDVVGLNLEDAFVDYTRGPRRSLPVFGEETTDGPTEHQRSRSRMIMIARKFSLLRQLAVGGDPRDRIRHALVCARGLARHLDSTRPGRAGAGGSYERLVVRSDGTLLIQSIPLDNLSAGDLSRPERPGAGRSGQKRPAPGRVHVRRAPRNPASFPRSRAGSRGSWSFVNEREPTVNWFFVHDGKPDGAGYFVGYERESNRRVGFIGMSGFRSDPVPAADWIPVRSALMTIEWSSAPASIYSGQRVDVAPTRALGCAAALGLCAIRKPTATGRPRRADGHDRL